MPTINYDGWYFFYTKNRNTLENITYINKYLRKAVEYYRTR